MQQKLSTDTERSAFQEGYKHGIAYILKKFAQQFATDSAKLADEVERVLSGDSLYKGNP